MIVINAVVVEYAQIVDNSRGRGITFYVRLTSLRSIYDHLDHERKLTLCTCGHGVWEESEKLFTTKTNGHRTTSTRER